MKYSGFYFRMFKSPMKKVLTEKYGKAYASEIMKKSRQVYRELVEKADDIGDDNPMAYNELFALAFVRAVCGKREEYSPGDRAGNDAPLALPYQVVLCQNRSEHRLGQGGEQKECRQLRQAVHPGKRGEVPDLLQGGFCRTAV